MSRSSPPTRGELAIRAKHRAARARAKDPQSLNDAVQNRMDERISTFEAQELMQPPEDLVSMGGEKIQPGFRLGYLVDTLQNPNMVSVIASEHRLDLAACVWSQVAESAIDAAESAKASNSLEKMLCHQMAATHCAAMKLTARSLEPALPPLEMARLSNAAARMMQVYQEAFLTLQKIRAGGRQTVVVQHVQVSEGGRAVISANMRTGEGGNVEDGGQG